MEKSGVDCLLETRTDSYRHRGGCPSNAKMDPSYGYQPTQRWDGLAASRGMIGNVFVRK